MTQKLDTKTQKIWDKAPICKCKKNNCHPNHHRLCEECGDKMLKGSYWGWYKDKQKRPKKMTYFWNKDHKKSKYHGGQSKQPNLRAIHVLCNEKKGARISSRSGAYLLNSNFGRRRG